ncbi:hypothetical protein BCU33_005610 [Vibrio lentus]|uniref:hypothetical protein n=1 Tax=Vibrio lentus TaxID=136468 RepID=UPI000C81678F|nr:hypothetical protein [Vibrio lentus]PMI96001.1 hypothetical protein BCU33_15065 [Vibrio lentus]
MLRFTLITSYLVLNAVFAYLIITGSTQSLWSDFSGLATVNVAFMTAFIVFFGMYQLNTAKEQLEESKQVNIKSLSHNSYSKYLQLALENPQFAFPNPDFIQSKVEVFAKYRWFVANMLFYFEEVLVVNDQDRNWSNAISRQIKIHMWYLENSNYRNQAWSTELVEIITKQVQVKSFRKKNTFVDNCNKASIHLLYEKYLNHLAEVPGFYDADGHISLDDYDKTAHTIYLKKALFILGQIAELSENEKEWLSLVQVEVNTLKSTYEKYTQGNMFRKDFLLKHHQKILNL